MLKPRRGAEQLFQFWRVQWNSGFAFFLPDLDFDQYPQLLIRFPRGLVEFFRQAHRVHRIYSVKQLCRFFSFIALQMADQVPLRIFEFIESRRLAFELLYSVLAKHAHSCRIGFLDPLWFHGLADGHEHNGTRVAVDFSGCPGNAFVNGMDVVSDRHEENLPRRHGDTEKTKSGLPLISVDGRR